MTDITELVERELEFATVEDLEHIAEHSVTISDDFDDMREALMNEFVRQARERLGIE